MPTTKYKKVGKFPIVDQGAKPVAGWTDDEVNVITDGLPLVLFGDHTRALKYIDFHFARGADGTQLLRTKSIIDTRFFYYACRAVDLPSRGYNRHFTMLRDREIRVPDSIEEQRHVADSLRVVEDAIALQKDALADLDELRMSVMARVFSRGIRGAALKSSALGDIPCDWEVVHFSEIRESLRYGTSTRATLTPAQYPVLRIPNILPAKVDTTELKYAELPREEARRSALEDGDVLFIRTNGVLARLGTCAVYHGVPNNALFASYLIRARMRRGIVPDYVAYFFGSSMGASVIAGRATPAADGKYNLNTGIIDGLEVPLPSEDEQAEIAQLLASLDHKIELHRAKCAMLEELFGALLHGLMDGDIDSSSLKIAPSTKSEKQLKESA